jgi:hypothetical protein
MARSSNEPIKATSLVIGAHAEGPILTVLAGQSVEANIRLNASLISLLARSLNQALVEQHALEARLKLKTGG